MNIKRFLIDFVIVFAVTLAVSAIVTLLWNLLGHGARNIDWESSFRFAVVLGILFPWMAARRRKET